jgi:hypothetical protein
MVWGYLPQKYFCLIFPLYDDFKFPRGHIKFRFSGVIDPVETVSARSSPAEIDQDLINRLLKETVWKAFCLLFFVS